LVDDERIVAQSTFDFLFGRAKINDLAEQKMRIAKSWSNAEVIFQHRHHPNVITAAIR
jgi:hypothetical protein